MWCTFYLPRQNNVELSCLSNVIVTDMQRAEKTATGASDLLEPGGRILCHNSISYANKWQNREKDDHIGTQKATEIPKDLWSRLKTIGKIQKSTPNPQE